MLVVPMFGRFLVSDLLQNNCFVLLKDLFVVSLWFNQRFFIVLEKKMA
jgi:hypothetical protein